MFLAALCLLFIIRLRFPRGTSITRIKPFKETKMRKRIHISTTNCLDWNLTNEGAIKTPSVLSNASNDDSNKVKLRVSATRWLIWRHMSVNKSDSFKGITKATFT